MIWLELKKIFMKLIEYLIILFNTILIYQMNLLRETLNEVRNSFIVEIFIWKSFKIPLGSWPTSDWLAKVVANEFQSGFEQNCGWLNDKTKRKEEKLVHGWTE
jgi:hypothetical protein